MIPVLLDINWTNVSSNWMSWFFTGYFVVIGEVWFYPLVFFGIIGYIYALSQSATAAAVAITIMFTVLGVSGIFSSIPEFTAISAGVTVTSIAAAFVAVFVGRKR